MTMYSRLYETAVRYPEYDAVVMNDTHISRIQLLSEIQKTENVLLSFGVQKGDTVTVSIPNCTEIVSLIYACNKLGVTVSLVHAGYDAESIVSKSAFTQSKLIIASMKELTDSDVAVFSKALIPVVLIPWVWGKKADKQRAERKACAIASLRRNVYFWSKKMKASNLLYKYNENRASQYENIEIAAYINTSGTSGGGTKTVALPDSAVVSDADRTGNTMYDYDKHCQMLVAMPVTHVFGFVIGIQCAIVNREGACVFMDNAANLLAYPKILQKHKIEVMIAVPSSLRLLLSLDSFKGDYSFLKLIFSGGESADEGLVTAFNNRLHSMNSTAVVRVGYGMTETSSVICVNKPDEYNAASVGKPLDGVKVRIIEPNEKGSGEISVSGDTLMRGYYKDDKANESVLVYDESGERWFRTGDLGHFDDEGFLIFDGRCKDIAIINGNNVCPSEIERVLQNYSYIKDCSVLGIDTANGTELYAAVVYEEGFKHGYFLEYCNSCLLSYEIPKLIKYDVLPYSWNGKKDINRIRKEISDKVQ